MRERKSGVRREENEYLHSIWRWWKGCMIEEAVKLQIQSMNGIRFEVLATMPRVAIIPVLENRIALKQKLNMRMIFQTRKKNKDIFTKGFVIPPSIKLISDHNVILSLKNTEINKTACRNK
jgi:hypothetical protein